MNLLKSTLSCRQNLEMISNKTIFVQKTNQLQCTLLFEDNFICSKQVYQNILNIFVLTETMMLIMFCPNNNILLWFWHQVYMFHVYLKVMCRFHAKKKTK